MQKDGSMVNGDYRGDSLAATPAEIAHELHLLRESQKTLVLKAAEAGLAVPRSCCQHQGDVACLSCSAEWLVVRVKARRVIGVAP